MSGISVVGRDTFGVFPLKGKLMNVRSSSPAAMMSNVVRGLVRGHKCPCFIASLAWSCALCGVPFQEIRALVTILGLKFGEVYETTKTLRYGHLMVMADQDHDGSHIKVTSVSPGRSRGI
jgi:DNA topoisomerase-2